MWERLENKESDDQPRIWEHQKSGEKVKVEKFRNGTWDTFRGEKLISNHDSADEAIRRCEDMVNGS